MKKFLLSAAALFLLVTAMSAQKIGTKDAKVSFDASSPVENIKAVRIVV